ncbi:MAG: MerR family transcriptional regulator [Bacteroidota bacterium]
MSIKTQFSIKDLENLTGVKAHTIRIWEKRYNLLTPARTDTNIRQYDLLNLKKLLNITFLYNEGYKISKIARFEAEEVHNLINGLAESSKENFAQQEFKKAMFDFDHYLFTKTYAQISQNKSFEEVFRTIFLPLLNEIGMLWQTGTIDPSHERFISELIKQKIIVNINRLREKNNKKQVPSFALYLPSEEIHEIGLLYANYEIIAAGFDTIYLGTDMPVESLQHIVKHYDQITFVSYFTVKPDQESLYDYIKRFKKVVGPVKPMNFWMMGWKVQGIDAKKLPPGVSVIPNFSAFKDKLRSLKSS